MKLPVPERLPYIRSVDELAALVQISAKLLYYMANHSGMYYRCHAIPKRNGGTRTIEAPIPILKRIQKRILTELLNCLVAHSSATAFEKGRSIRDNAAIHVWKPVVLKLDVRDFFPSIHVSKVYGLFRFLGYEKPVASLLAHLCCLDSHLPQGAPTSPKLSNLVMYDVDDALSRWAELHVLDYSRYADDMTFSGAMNPNLVRETIRVCRREIRGVGLNLNPDKIRIQRRGGRQSVTGLIVNEKLNVPREFRRALRLRMHYLARFGPADDLRGSGNELRRLLGEVDFAAGVVPDPQLEQWRRFLRFGEGVDLPPWFFD